MSDYKQKLISRFGLKVIEFNLDDLKLGKGETLPEELAGQTIHVKKLSGRQFETFAAANADIGRDEGGLASSKFEGMRARFIAMCLCDPAGELLWENPDEINESLSNIAIGGLFLACQQVNGMGAKAVEEAEKNS